MITTIERQIKTDKSDDTNVALSINVHTIEIGTDENPTSFPNPLAVYGDLPQQAENYLASKEEMTAALRAELIEKCVETLHLLGKEKANVNSVCSNEFYLKVLFGIPQEATVDDYNLFHGADVFGLPTKEIYILPPVDIAVSGELFCLSGRLPENTLLCLCEEDLTLMYIGKDNNTYTYLWDADYSPLFLLTVRAALRVLRPEGTYPLVRLYGKYASFLEDIFLKEGLSFTFGERDFSVLIKACSSPAVRSRLEQEKRRTSFHNLLKDEEFQEALNTLSEEGL